MAEQSKREASSEPAPKLALPQVSLPKGGGAIQGMGEKFNVNAATGTGSLTVPISASPGRSGVGPQLSLSYDSGAPNGPFGFGWSLGLPSVSRKTDKGLPRYDDANESDVFLLSGAEDLVPVLNTSGQPLWRPRKVHGVDYRVHFYRPRIEGLFASIERWENATSGLSFWRTISRDNVGTLYGFTPDSRIGDDPTNPRRIFTYLICRTWDDRGNVTVYEYKREDDAQVLKTSAHESNRNPIARTTNNYIKSIRYGGATPWYPNWREAGPQTALPASWYFELVFDYGDHREKAPVRTPDKTWPVRPDPFSSHRAGFEVRTYRRCERILMFHHFPAEANVGNDCLVSSTDLTYSDEVAPTAPQNPIYTFLHSVTHRGYRRDGNDYVIGEMPSLEFEYSEPRLSGEVQTLDVISAENLPVGLQSPQWQWLDLNGEGTSGVLTELDGGWGYKRNVSPGTRVVQPAGTVVTTAKLGAMERVATLPDRRELSGGLQFLDLGGDGRVDAVTFEQPTPGFYERTTDENWESFRPFQSLPDLVWSTPNLKFVDLTGDGHADILLTEDDVFTVYPSRGEGGFDAPVLVQQPWDESDGPRIVLGDGTETVFLGDMSGDGLSDLVRVRNGEVCYWPSLGYGRFSRKITMDFSPRFADEERFDPRRLRFADIDGSGTTDLLYVGEDGVSVYFNRSGNSWAAPQQLAVFPSADAVSGVQVMDLLGTGTSCLVWSSPLPGVAGRALRYVNLMGGEKPHLMITSRNNLGAETCLRYVPSTYFYCKDRDAGRPWITRLPYPVHVVERVEVYDWIGRSRFVTRYAYHHGFFDGEEREFRGFGMVEQWDTEEHRSDTAFPAAANWNATSWSPPVRTCTWFHTGQFVESGVVSRQYATEYWVEPGLRDDTHVAEREAMLLADSVIPSGLTPDETREAYRALKGMPLRAEVYAEDGTVRSSNPYTVTETNYTVRREQRFGVNRHAVFFAHPRETLSSHYERQNDDPRVAHDVTLEVDLFGNVKRNVAVSYSRRPGYADPEPQLSAAFKSMLAYDQGRIHIAATEYAFTNDLADRVAYPDTHRAPQPCGIITAELTGPPPTAQLFGVTNLYRFGELDTLWAAAWTGANDVPYEEVFESDVNGAGTLPTTVRRRVVERSMIRYRKDDLTALLAVGTVESGALPGESYKLAFTSTLLNRVFGPRVTPATLAQGGYAQLAPGTDWWIPSGTIYFSPGDNDTPIVEFTEARAHFYQPRRSVDPFGGTLRATHDSYDLLPTSTTDAVGNTTTAANNYRVLHPMRVTDPNGNRADAAFDALGLIVGTALLGKVNEVVGDSLVGFQPDLTPAVVQAHVTDPTTNPGAILGDATSRFTYDVLAYQRTRNSADPSPTVAYTLKRKTHVADLAVNQTTPYTHAFSYSDGFGREIQRKIQAEAAAVDGVGPNVSPRWVGSAWVINNNKGAAVRRYEPFFSDTHAFEFGRVAGVSTVTFYDPAERAVAVLHPNDTWEKVAFDAWRQCSWDTNDTVGVADPRNDLHVGVFFRRLLGSAPNAFTSWYVRRIGGNFGATVADRPAEQDAAQKAILHDDTPTSSHFDARGRTCLTVAHNGGTTRFATRIALDAEDKPLAVFDARERRVVEYCLRQPLQNGGFQYFGGYDVVGNVVYRNSMDGGAERTIANIAGNVLRSWDSHGREFQMRYDAAQRQTHRLVTIGGATPIVLERRVYGEGLANRNLCGRLARYYDTAGVAISERCDFKGNLVQSSRQLAGNHRELPDWTPLANLTQAADLDVAAAPLLAPNDLFVAHTTYDALNRPIQVITPARAGTPASVIQPSYNEANLLDRVDVWVRIAAPPAVISPASATVHAVTDVAYNARGQRTEVRYGNGTVTRYEYDGETFRLMRLRTERPVANWPNDCPSPAPAAWQGCRIQNLSYAFDPMGNITRIRDDAQQTIFFRNRRVEPTADYTYDATYRLVIASGREHLGQQGGALAPPVQVDHDDGARRVLHPGDGNAVGTYTESFTYDSVGNILDVVHQVVTGTWRRTYTYAEPSLVDSSEMSNRLSRTRAPGDPVSGPFTATYTHDAGGNLAQMPHLPGLDWDAGDRLRWTTTQAVNNATPERTYFAYDATGLRIRKAKDSGAPSNQYGTRERERLYLGPIEIYREFAVDGTTVTLERETLRVDAGSQSVVEIDTRTVDDGVDPAPAQMVRFQYANQVGSACLELDENAAVISYEEYFPYGSTSYQAVRSNLDRPKIRRYTGKERDEESGLYYHGARYYAPWLGRWISPDPTGLRDGPNLYAYVSANPIRLQDPRGTEGVYYQDEGVCVAEYPSCSPEQSACGETTSSPKSIRVVKNSSAAAGDTQSGIDLSAYDDPEADREPTLIEKTREAMQQSPTGQLIIGLGMGGLAGAAPGGFIIAPAGDASGFSEDFPAPMRLGFGIGEAAWGVAQVIGGAGGEAGGVALDATGVGAVAGVPLNIASAAVIVEGAADVGVGVKTAYKAAKEGGFSKEGPKYKTSRQHKAGNRQVETEDGRRYHVPKGQEPKIVKADPVGNKLQAEVTKAAGKWNKGLLSPAEVEAIAKAKDAKKFWLANLLEKQAKGRFIHEQVKAVASEISSTLKYSANGVDFVDTSTGLKYEVLSGTTSNMDIHAFRMAAEFFRMLVF